MDVITFDGDGTLWDIRNVIKKALKRVLEVIQERYPDISIDIEEFYTAWDRVSQSNPGMSLYDIRKFSIFEVLEKHGIFSQDFGDELFELYLRERHSEIEIYPDTIPVLTELKKSYKIGLITNGNTRFQDYPVAGFFDFTVRAADVGSSKPDSLIFEYAVNLAGTERDRILHVGDSLEEDYLGAINAGLKALWLNRENLPVPEGVKSINSLSELLKML